MKATADELIIRRALKWASSGRTTPGPFRRADIERAARHFGIPTGTLLAACIARGHTVR